MMGRISGKVKFRVEKIITTVTVRHCYSFEKFRWMELMSLDDWNEKGE